MIAHSLDDCGRSGVAHAESFADRPADKCFATRRAVQDDVPGDDVVLGHERCMCFARRPHHQTPARQPLAEVVVGVAVQPHRQPTRHKRTEALPGRPVERQIDRVIGQAVAAVHGGDSVAEHRADRPVHVADRKLRPHQLAALKRRRRQFDEPAVEGPLQAMVLAHRAVAILRPRRLGLRQDRRQVQTVRLPVSNCGGRVEPVNAPDGLPQRSKAQHCQVLTDLLSDVLEEVHDELGPATEAPAQFAVLGCDAYGTGVEMADAHHDAARDHQWGRRKAILLGAQKCCHDHVAARLQLPVGLHHDPVSQAVQQ